MNCSSFLLNSAVRHHLSLQEDSLAVGELCENFCVDDLLSGADTMDGVEQLYEKAKAIMNRPGVVLTKWSSNSPLFEDKISDSSTKILESGWNSERHVFCFRNIDIPVGLVATKRAVLSSIARLYNSLRFVAPFTMDPTMLFQHLWRLGP